MRSSIAIAVAAAGLAVVAGCSKGGDNYQPKTVKTTTTVDTSKGEALFPLAVGNQWVYDIVGQTIQNGKPVSFTAEITWKVTKVEKRPDGGKRATIDVSNAGKLNDRQIWEVSDKGLFQISVGVKPNVFNPPAPALIFPVEKGKVFTWKGTGVLPGAKSGMSKSTSKVIGTSEVDVVTGPPLQAVQVETITDFGAGKGSVESNAFFSPNVGIVRYVQIVKTKTPAQLLYRLKSHRFPNVSK